MGDGKIAERKRKKKEDGEEAGETARRREKVDSM